MSMIPEQHTLNCLLHSRGSLWLTATDLCSHPQIQIPMQKDAGLPVRESVAEGSPGVPGGLAQGGLAQVYSTKSRC